jgi:hypothetical protein
MGAYLKGECNNIHSIRISAHSSEKPEDLLSEHGGHGDLILLPQWVQCRVVDVPPEYTEEGISNELVYHGDVGPYFGILKRLMPSGKCGLNRLRHSSDFTDTRVPTIMSTCMFVSFP